MPFHSRSVHCELIAAVPLFDTGAAERPAGDPQALLALARRIRTFPEGKHTPSPLPRLLHELTDELLVVASNAVSGVGREEPVLSANAALRLLAWTVADAGGATVALDKPLALTVGKRLNRQAQSVRANITSIGVRAEKARARARDAAEGEPKLTAKLATELAAIDGEERTSLLLARTEVYVGFNELESLLPEAEVDARVDEWAAKLTPAALAEAVDAAAAAEAVDAAAAAPDELTYSSPGPMAFAALQDSWAAVNIRHKLHERMWEGSAMPRELIERIGVTATWKLNDIMTRAGLKIYGVLWWTSALPLLVNSMVRELAAERRRHESIVSLKGWGGKSKIRVRCWPHERRIWSSVVFEILKSAQMRAGRI